MIDDWFRPSSYLILIVDDHPVTTHLLRKSMESEGFKTLVAPSGDVALKIVPRSLPDLILLDVMMPGLDGFETCRKLKEDPATRDIPIIFVTGKSDSKDVLKGFDVGGVDYISKPLRPKEVLLRIKTHLKLWMLIKRYEKNIDELREANLKLDDLADKLKEANLKLDNLANVDPLTGILNRRAVKEKMEDERTRFERTKEPYSVILGDLDHFIKINDNFGHDAGDYLLIQISKILKEKIRKPDFVSRWGGEAFLLFLPETDLNGAVNLAEKLRQSIESTHVIFNQHKFNVTMSLGVSVYKKGMTIDDCIQKADGLLCRAKEAGRNKVIRDT